MQSNIRRYTRVLIDESVLSENLTKVSPNPSPYRHGIGLLREALVAILRHAFLIPRQCRIGEIELFTIGPF